MMTSIELYQKLKIVSGEGIIEFDEQCEVSCRKITVTLELISWIGAD